MYELKVTKICMCKKGLDWRRQSFFKHWLVISFSLADSNRAPKEIAILRQIKDPAKSARLFSLFQALW